MRMSDAASSRTAVNRYSAAKKAAGMKKTMQTGVMNKNRATKGAMASAGKPAAKRASSPSVQVGIMSKNRAAKGAMSYLGDNSPKTKISAAQSRLAASRKAAAAKKSSQSRAMAKNRASRGAMGR